MGIKRIVRFMLWVSFCGFCGLLLGSKSAHYYQSALLSYSLLGAAFGLVLAVIFDSRDKKQDSSSSEDL